MNFLNLFIKTAYAATVQDIINKVIEQAVQPLIGFMMFLATVVFVYGIVEFIANTDDVKKRTDGKKHIFWGILGLFIMIAASGLMWVLVRFWQSV